MIVRMGLLTRRADIAPSRFGEHWRTVHGPLAARLPGLRAYHQNRVLEVEGTRLTRAEGPWRIDGMSELWFDDLASMRGAIASDVYGPIARDSEAFVSATRVIVAEQRVVVPLPDGAGPLVKRMSLVSRRPDQDADRFREAWWPVHATLARHVPDLVACTVNVIVDRETRPGTPSAYGDVPVDGVVEAWFRDVGSLRGAASSETAIEERGRAQGLVGEIASYVVETHRIV